MYYEMKVPASILARIRIERSRAVFSVRNLSLEVSPTTFAQITRQIQL